MSRAIIHLDLDAFFCSVEELQNPALRGKAFAVGGRPESRGVVASCSYPARRRGVRSAMPMAQAVRLCPGLLVAPAQHRLYRTVSRKVMGYLATITPRLEQISIDEAFLDISEQAEAPAQLAIQLQQHIRQEFGLPCSLGVASNKLVAKIATNVGKDRGRGDGPPNAIQVVAVGEEAAFLAPLPCAELWGVGPKTAALLAALGMHTIGDIAQWPADDLARRFGKHGQELAKRARGEDDRPVVTEYDPRSVSQETTFAQDVRDGARLRQTLQGLAQGVSRDLKRKGLAGITVKLKLRWFDFVTLTRQSTLAQPTDDAARIGEVAERLLEKVWAPGQAVRLLGVGVSGLGMAVRQPGLWDVPDERSERLSETLRAVRKRYGDGAVRRGSDLLADE
jgi:DNA polymerase IV